MTKRPSTIEEAEEAFAKQFGIVGVIALGIIILVPLASLLILARVFL